MKWFDCGRERGGKSWEGPVAKDKQKEVVTYERIDLFEMVKLRKQAKKVKKE